MRKMCNGPECDRPSRTNGFCSAHYLQSVRGNGLRPLNLRRQTDHATRNDLGQKKCMQCALWQDIDNYVKHKGKPDGLSPYCRRCDRENYLRRTYVMDIEAYEAQLTIQGGTCAIDGCSATDLHIDHDHRCCPGKKSCGRCVRALLCQPHNTILGLVGESTDHLQSLIKYLEFYADWSQYRT